MKLYDHPSAPSPRRVRIFLAEKGVTVERETVALRDLEQYRSPFQRRNPWGTVPVLELDDGTHLAETVAICRYIEELHPEPPLMGADPLEAGLVEMWHRRVEQDGYWSVAHAIRNSAPLFADAALPGWERGLPAIPALVERSRLVWERLSYHLERRLAAHPFVVGDRFTIVDITLLVTIDFGRRTGFLSLAGLPSLRRWHAEAGARPSAGA